MSKTYDVGYGKPPKQTRFQKGVSGNPAGRPKKYKSPISVLEAPITMTVAGKKREVSAFEASLRKTAQSALEGSLPAIKRFFNYCDDANLLVDPTRPSQGGVLQVPINLDMFPDREFSAAEIAEVEYLNSQLNKPPPADPPSEKEVVIIKVAREKHFVETLGRNMTIFELVQQKLRQRALVERHQPSHAYFEKLLLQTTLDIDAPNVGHLVVPAPMPLGSRRFGSKTPTPEKKRKFQNRAMLTLAARNSSKEVSQSRALFLRQGSCRSRSACEHPID